MRKGKKITFLVSTLCVVILFSLLLCNFVTASENEAVTNVFATTSASTVKQGNTGYCYVYIDSLENVSTLSVSVHFDPSKVSVSSGYVYNKVSSLVYDSALNLSNVQFSYIFDGNGEAKQTQLFYFRYNVLSDAEIGETFFDIVVNEAYDSSLNELQIKGSRCKFTIEEKTTQKQCSIYSTSSISTSVDNEFDISYRLSTSQIASGSFIIEYDNELFEFVSLTNGNFFNNKIVDANTSIPGTIYVSFVGNEYNSYTNLFTLRLKTKENKTTTSDVKLTVKELYDLSLAYVSCSGYTNKINVSYDNTHIDDQVPKVTVNTEYLKEQGQMIVKILLGANSHLGAGDFEFAFDTKYFIYNSSQKGMSPTFFTINDKNASSGKLKFSIISMSDIVTAETLVTVVLDVIPNCSDFTTEFAISGSGIADSLTNLVTLNFINSTENVQGLGHDIIDYEGKEPTCLDKGWYAYEGCKRCDYATDKVEISPLGHNEIVISAKQETCTEIGWNEYVKCSRCDYTTYSEIPATGHMVIVIDKYITNLYELINDANCPFEYSNGIYSSTNKNHSTTSTFTITALYDFEITIRYSVSSEANWDKLFIYKNGSQLDNISGEISDKEITISLAKNDVVTVKYQKDGSVSKYSDTGYFEILTENSIEIIGETLVSVDKFEATCTEGVTCSVCGVLAKPAKEHTYIETSCTDSTCLEAGKITYTCECGDTYEKTLEKLPHTEEIIPAVPSTSDANKVVTPGMTSGVKCSECGETLVAPEVADTGFNINGRALNISESLKIIYRNYVPAGYENVRMVINFRGNTYEIKEYTIDEKTGRYCFDFTAITPQYMNVNIEAWLLAEKDGKTVSFLQEEYSIKTYCLNNLAKESSSTTLKTLLTDLLIYGEMLQKYVGGECLNNGLITEGVDLSYASTYAELDASFDKRVIPGKISDELPYWSTATLYIANSVSMKFKFYATDIAGLEIKATVKGRTTTFDADDFVLGTDGRYEVTFTNVTALEFDETVVADFYLNGEKIEGTTLEYTINSYVQRNQNYNNATLVNFLKALNNYGRSAYRYVNG